MGKRALIVFLALLVAAGAFIGVPALAQTLVENPTLGNQDNSAAAAGEEGPILDPSSPPLLLQSGSGDGWTETNTPIIQANTPTARVLHAMAATPSGDVLLFGGNSGNKFADTWLFDTTTGTWTNVTATNTSPTNTPSARNLHAMATTPSGVLLFGGWDNSTYFNDTWLYTIDNTTKTGTWTETNTPIIQANTPTARQGHAMAYDASSGKVLLFGGNAGSSGTLEDTWLFDTSTGSWSQVTTSATPGARFNFAMAATPSGVLLFGGNAPPNFLYDTWTLTLTNNADTWTGTWTNVTAPDTSPTNTPTARDQHAMAATPSGDVLLFGGTSSTNSPLSDTWLFDTSTNSWSQVSTSPTPTARDQHSMATTPSGVLLFGGNDGVNNLNDTWLYGPVPTIAVTSPNGGESWAVGTTENITWTSTDVTGTITIELSRDNGVNWASLTTTTATQGSYAWTVNGAATSSALVRVSATGCMDDSDAVFSITGPSITLSIPNGGESWQVDTAQDITWTSSGLTGTCLVVLSRDGGSSWTETLTTDTATQGTYSWPVTSPTSAQCKVKISSTENPAISDISDGVFSIVESRSIQVTYPKGGEFLKLGTPIDITWTNSGLTGGNVKIEISYNQMGTRKTLVDSTENDGLYQWTNSGSISSACRIRISSIDAPGISDISDFNFDIWDFNAWEPMTAGFNGGSGGVAVGMKPGTPSIVLAGRANNGGCYRSTDGGRTWEPVVGDMSSTSPWGFAWVPGTSTVFAACAESISRSTDDGVNWEKIAGGPGGLRCIAIDPNSPNTLYVGNSNGHGVFRSTDSGNTWSQTNSGLPDSPNVISIAIDPFNLGHVYAATGGFDYISHGEGVYRSVDGGDNWSSMNDGLPPATSTIPLDTRYLAFTPSTATNTYLYCGTHRNGIYRLSYTDTQTWTHSSSGFTPSCAEVIAIDPDTPSILYASNMWPPMGTPNGLFKSTDGGDSWHQLDDPSLTGVGIAISPSNTSRILMSNWYEGIMLSDDQGETWNVSNIGFGKAFRGVASPKDSTTLFTFYDGPQRDPMLKSLDGGMNWTNSASGMSATGVELVVDPSDTKILYEAQVQGSGVYRTTDGGENWYAMNNGLPLGQFAWPNWGVKTLVCDPATKGRLFAGIDALGALGGVYIYENEVWTQSNTGLSPGTITIEVRSIVVDHRDPGIDPVLYASVLNAGIFRSDDGGLKWHPMNNGFPIQTQCDRIVMDKDDPLILYAATGAGVYKTINGGAEWKLVGSPSVAQYIALHPQNPNTAYVGYWEYGIYRTIDGGTTWSSMNEGLLNTRFHWLGVEPNNPGYLFLGNPRGLYRYISPSLFFTDLKLYQPVKAGDLVGAVLGGVMNNPAAEDGGESRQVRARLQLENLDQNLITSAKYENPDSLDNWLDATLASDSAGGTYVQTPSFTFTPSSSKHCNFRLTVSATTPMGTHRTVLSLIEDGTNWVLATKTGQLTVVLESASALNGAVILPGTGVHLAVTGSGTGWGGVYTSQPTGTTTPPGSVLKYLDVCFTPAGEASGTATVMVEYTTTGTYILSFWDGAQWRLADPQWDEPANHRVVGHVPYIYLQGTPFALAGQQGPTQTGTIALTVVDPEGHLLAGASFRLGPGSIDQTTDGTHNPLLWGGLSLGNYTLTQLSAPSGFLPDPTFPRSLTLPSVEEPLLSLTATCPLQGPVSVPSLSIWGLASLALALLGGGVWRLRRKNKA